MKQCLHSTQMETCDKQSFEFLHFSFLITVTCGFLLCIPTVPRKTHFSVFKFNLLKSSLFFEESAFSVFWNLFHLPLLLLTTAF